MVKVLQQKQLYKFQMKFFTNIFVSLFYVGYIKYFPGTFGSLFSLIILFPVVALNLISIKLFILIFIIIFILSIFFINKFSYYTKTNDSNIIIIDEFLGIYFILIFYELIYFVNAEYTILLIFLLFRFFDVLKIFPANLIDKKIKNPFGVILDDIIASIYTVIIIYMLNVYN